MEDDPIGFPAPLWKQLGELGLTGLTLPEAYGGGGQSALEAMIVYEELGRALAPTPHFVSAVLVGRRHGARRHRGAEARVAAEDRERRGDRRRRRGSSRSGGYGPPACSSTATGSGGNREAQRDASATCSSRRRRRGSSCWRGPAAAPTDVDLLLVDPAAPGRRR